MNALNKILILSTASLIMTGCNDLDTEPMGGTVTSDQKASVIATNPQMLQASVSTVPGMMKQILNCGFGNVHTDYGYPSMLLMYDSRGMDMPSALGDYQWYTGALEMSDFGDNYYDNLLTWNTMYNLIYSCNSLANIIAEDTEDPEQQMSLAQAFAFRAFAYYTLGQVYQFTYYGNEDKPTVPLILHTNASEVAANGAPRATNEELYAQIVADLTTAIGLLDKAEAAGVHRQDKTYVGACVAYGLRARAYMMMNKWAECEADAQKAIQLAQAEGLTPYTRQEVSVPAFVNITDHSWMWGIDIQEEVIGTASTVTFGGHMGEWLVNGYARYGHWRNCNKALYNQIPASDVRKNWWCDKDGKAPSTLPSNYKEFIANHESLGVAAFLPFTQVKFGAYNDNPGGNIAAGDVPVMRVEEMYLMLAEAQGMQDPGRGLQTLTNFVKTYRNPDYVFGTSSKDALRDEIWFQRRIELWGEGFSYSDMMRLKKTLDRRGGGFDPTLVFVVAPDDPCLLYVIPRTEQEANPQIGRLTTTAAVPTAVPDID